nr:hypothetical protein CFP56_26000 [Quercus suber]
MPRIARRRNRPPGGKQTSFRHYGPVEVGTWDNTGNRGWTLQKMIARSHSHGASDGLQHRTMEIRLSPATVPQRNPFVYHTSRMESQARW